MELQQNCLPYFFAVTVHGAHTHMWTDGPNSLEACLPAPTGGRGIKSTSKLKPNYSTKYSTDRL